MRDGQNKQSRLLVVKTSRRCSVRELQLVSSSVARWIPSKLYIANMCSLESTAQASSRDIIDS